MEEKNLDYLVKRLRENEEKTYEIAKVLGDFNHTVGNLIEHVGHLTQSETFREGVSHLGQMKEHYSHIKDELKRLAPTQTYLSDSAILYKENILVIGPDRKSLYAYDNLSQTLECKFTLHYEVRQIWTIYHKLYALSTEGKVYSVGLQNSLQENIKAVKVSPYGMVLLTQTKGLIFYPLMGRPLNIGEGILSFEILLESLLIYITAEETKQIDLSTL
ncbi:MAG: hypothetical protein H9893_02355 [Candidatus Niameybacter stercoravium]|nr:hypothetical protein [Candidatus Niameybacter stercoravium]